jgi:predicted 3-demethylubiquinone-9 3-methyltransferase (glyoxalase superfamily)
MVHIQKISPMLWFDDSAEMAARHYVRGFPNSRITDVQRYPEGGPVPYGTVMTVSFELAGQPFTALNGGSTIPPNESVSFVVACEDQHEIDFLWGHLSEGGSTSMCGWLKDRWGFSWQVVPRRFLELVTESEPAVKSRVFAAMMEMKKFDLMAIERAASGT